MNWKTLLLSCGFCLAAFCLTVFISAMTTGEIICAYEIANAWQNSNNEIDITIGCGVGIAFMFILGIIAFIACIGMIVSTIITCIIGWTDDDDDWC